VAFVGAAFPVFIMLSWTGDIVKLDFASGTGKDEARFVTSHVWCDQVTSHDQCIVEW